MKKKIKVKEFKKYLREEVEYKDLNETTGFDLDKELGYLKSISPNKHAFDLIDKSNFIGWFSTKYNSYGYLFFELTPEEKNILGVNSDNIYRVIWDKGTTIAKVNLNSQRITFSKDNPENDKIEAWETPIKADHIIIYN